MDGRILRAWMPAIHAGMTEAADGQTSSNIDVGVEGCNSFFMLLRPLLIDIAQVVSVSNHVPCG